MKSLVLALLATIPALAQIDIRLASQYFDEAEAICAREGGSTWSVPLCGPGGRLRFAAQNRGLPAGLKSRAG